MDTRLWIASIAGAMLLTFFGCHQAEQQKSAPGLDLALINGDSISLSSLQGDYVLLEFWGSWCAPCLRQMPQWKQLYEDYSSLKDSSGAGFTILSVALERQKSRAARVGSNLMLPWPYQAVEQSRFVPLARAARAYGVTEIPQAYLIDPSGQLVLSHASPDQVRHFLTEVMED